MADLPFEMWQGASVAVTYRSIYVPADGDSVAQFLSSSTWPFHSQTVVSVDAASQFEISSERVESYWILDGGSVVGLVRLLDLDDIDCGGSPMFDLRIAEGHRGRGIGTHTVDWLTTHLFVAHPALHRIEATTRADNVAMRTVLERCKYVAEGEFREAWTNEDGTRSNASTYAILRSDWTRP